ncbi:hypothetical protein [Chryseobacterium sp. S90]|uniref:hypothetical protein n=1 Tax=Chryseobacterium sp. S90 TaxID=3395373 RepID=UPI0039BCF264
MKSLNYKDLKSKFYDYYDHIKISQSEQIAIQYEKEIQDRSDDEEIEYVEEIEEEFQKENVFISKKAY